MFNINKEMSTSYNNNDIYISKLKFFRMKYLIEKEKNDIARIELRNEKVAHVLLEFPSDDTFEIDLSNNNIKFYEISRIRFIKSN